MFTTTHYFTLFALHFTLFIVSIFKAYDIRGIYPSELNNKMAYNIGRSIVKFLKADKIIIGYDGRASSLSLFNHLSQGIIDQNADVINIGLVSTPLLYFASQKAPAIMITASHLPKEYNGFKLCQKGGIPIGEEEIQEIKRIIEENKFLKLKSTGNIVNKEIMPEFIKYNLNFAPANNKKTKIILDAGNGMSGYTLPKIFKKIKAINLIEQYTDVDFSFPNHQANPLDFETLKDLQKRIKKEKADFGFATDADGDRSIFVDEKGKIIPSDLIISLIGKHLLKKNPGAKIMYDIRCSKIVKETIEKNNGKAIISRVGHSFIKKKMREKNVIFAGEISGHFYYQKNNYTESPFISVIFIANILSNSLNSLSNLIKPFQKYFSSGEINFQVKDKNLKINEIKKKFKKKALKIEKLDGLSIYFQDWWFNIRKSNTENLLRLNLEADTKKLMKQKISKLVKIIKK